MARKLRIEKNGFYHIVNRGVARDNIYNSTDDFMKFLQIMQDASEDYDFEIYSFCLMNNHYHLLMKINNKNLSIIMQKINSRYSMYFNRKYKRVGPLWQGRFKSWFIYDEHYLKVLVKYIEYNPIKANIVDTIGKYRWAMSSKNVEFFTPRALPSERMLNFDLVVNTDFSNKLDETELEKIDELYHAKIEIKDDKITKKELRPLSEYFGNFAYSREYSISKAVNDGYKQIEIGRYLNLSNVAISKIVKIYKQKVRLFDRLRDKGLFWSYSKKINFEQAGESLMIEYLLKYGDFYDISLGFKLFGKRVIKRAWEEKLKSDLSFIKLNLMLARVFFNMDVESDYFKGVKNARFEKLKLLAS